MRIVQSGFRPANSATTMPLKPALPVKPVSVPSVTIRCEMLPTTSMAPATPDSAPARVIASVMVDLTDIPAYLDASRDSPMARILKPRLVCHISTQTATASRIAMSTPRCNWVPAMRIGSQAFFDSSRVCGMSPPTAYPECATRGPESR